MAATKAKPSIIYNLEIEELVTQGKGLTHTDEGKVVFVNNALPGDIVDVQVVKEKKDYEVGHAFNFRSYSDWRVEPFCEHFGLCGGCKFQNLAYIDQLSFKQKVVREAFERIAKLSSPVISDILPAQKQRFFRNKLEFTFSKKGWKDCNKVRNGEFDKKETQPVLGFHLPNQWDKVLDIDYCYLQDDPSNEIRLALRDYALRNDIPFFDKVKQKGFLRNLIIRMTQKGEIMVIVTFYKDNKRDREAVLNFLQKKFPQISSLLYVINPKGNPTIDNLKVHCYAGKDHIVEQLEDLNFKIGPKSFFQTNTEQALKVYRTIRDFADLTGGEILYDLYTGIGTIGLFLARSCQRVVGIEQVAEAVDYAQVNAQWNDIENSHFFSGTIQQTLTKEMTTKWGNPEVVVTNPGRRGMHKRVVSKLKGIKPAKIIYVSCNPTTQARDFKRLQHLYDIKAIQPVDMFPQTAHVENILFLKRKPQVKPDYN